MTDLLNRQADDRRSAERLHRTYQTGLIAPEKKPFLIDLQRSSGPFLAVDQGAMICDGASQIASVGLGFNAGALFGTTEYLESWINQTESEQLRGVRLAYQELLQRKIGSDRFVARFYASGAEAIESALAHFFDQRPHPDARRVLAFHGSFHGRMMVALASTWNPAKREPFAWPGYESVFAQYPEMDTDDIGTPREPREWMALWTTTDTAEFEAVLARCQPPTDRLLQAEIESLREVRRQLQSGKVFAILLEPMQCEGGDRYSSARFHQGLACLSTTFDVPLVYDEIQTGYGLGGEFFWHRMFDLRTPAEGRFFPDAVVCAKKAQTGVVLTKMPASVTEIEPPDIGYFPHEHFSAASLVRGYIQASVIDQFECVASEIETVNRQHLTRLVSIFSQQIHRPRAKGLCFAFDLDSPALMNQFVENRFRHGLIYYPAGATTARFRLNLGFRPADVSLFWSQLQAALQATFSDGPPTESVDIQVQPRETESYYDFHGEFIRRKLQNLDGEASLGRADIAEFLRRQLRQRWPDVNFDVIFLNRAEYPNYREQILQLQAEVYEPARQSTAAEFDRLFGSDNPLSILIVVDRRIVAMAFAGPLQLFRHQRGVDNDPYRDDPTVAYVLDLTIAQAYRGHLGRLMKQAITMLAQTAGMTAIHGRNRDRLAAGMWSINLSLGSYATQYLVDDYPDQEPRRDCIYYRCPTVWRRPPIDLSSGVEMPLGVEHLDMDFVREHLSVMVNKLTLSNFVTERFLDQLEAVAQVFPASLRHIYTGNGLSECVDKLVKVLWRHRRPRTRLITIEQQYFGSGSLLSRTLSGLGQPFFEPDRLPIPRGIDDEPFFAALDARLQTGEFLGMFVEPVLRRSMLRMPLDVLQRIVETCRRHATPIVFNETASLFYRYDQRVFTASGLSGIEPDASIVFLGGQMALVCASKELFIDEPLLLISTWEGDAFSLAQFHRGMEVVQADKAAYFRTVAAYHDKLTSTLRQDPNATSHLTDGIGWIAGLPKPLTGMFRQVRPGRYLSCPSYSEMLRFLKLPL